MVVTWWVGTAVALSPSSATAIGFTASSPTSISCELVGHCDLAWCLLTERDKYSCARIQERGGAFFPLPQCKLVTRTTCNRCPDNNLKEQIEQFHRSATLKMDMCL